MDSAEILLVGGPLDGKVKRIPAPFRQIPCQAVKERGPFDPPLTKSRNEEEGDTVVFPSTEAHTYRPLWIDPASKVPSIYAHEKLSNSEVITKLIAGYKV